MSVYYFFGSIFYKKEKFLLIFVCTFKLSLFYYQQNPKNPEFYLKSVSYNLFIRALCTKNNENFLKCPPLQSGSEFPCDFSGGLRLAVGCK